MQSKKPHTHIHTDTRKDSVVLVCILKNYRDLEVLFKERWYRIPFSHAPVRTFDYLAFYLPAQTGVVTHKGASHPLHLYDKCIQYYTKVKHTNIVKRRELLPDETTHPDSNKPYLKIHIGNIMKLKSPIKNKSPRRVSFCFTTLKNLKNSKNILDVYEVFPTEKIIGDALKNAEIQSISEHTIVLQSTSHPTKIIRSVRYRLDFAIYCKKGKIAIECDNTKAHSSSIQKKKDEEKDIDLKKDYWEVIRIKEKEVVAHGTENSITRIKKVIKSLGGQVT